MILTRARLRRGAAARTQFWRLADHEYALHQLVWRLFADRDERQRDFLYRVDERAAQPCLYLLSQRPPAGGSDLFELHQRPFAPQLRPGDRLRFSLRANPIVSRGGKRHDVVMDAKTRLGWKTLPATDRPPLAQLVQEAGGAWLAQRAAQHGFELVPGALRVDGYLNRRLRKHGREIRLSTVDFDGELVVREPASFLRLLAEGLGPAKGFGCGLLLVARA